MKSNEHPHSGLAARERQIMEVVHRLGRASVSEVVEMLPDAPGYSSVRKTMSLLEEKGHLRHELDGRRYVYSAASRRESVGRRAASHLLETFFHGSVEAAVTTLLRARGKPLSAAELARLRSLLEQWEELG